MLSITRNEISILNIPKVITQSGLLLTFKRGCEVREFTPMFVNNYCTTTQIGVKALCFMDSGVWALQITNDLSETFNTNIQVQ